MDYLYLRGKEYGASEEVFKYVLWIMWYICKARNRKIFENISEHPKDTLGIAIQEEEAWRRANTREKTSDETHSRDVVDLVPQDIPICYIDGSWYASYTRSGQDG